MMMSDVRFTLLRMMVLHQMRAAHDRAQRAGEIAKITGLTTQQVYQQLKTLDWYKLVKRDPPTSWFDEHGEWHYYNSNPPHNIVTWSLTEEGYNLAMISYLLNTRTNRKFEIIKIDRDKNLLTLKGETGGQFEESYDKAKLKALGYIYVQQAESQDA